MPTCLHCGGRRGKRECPALRGKICAGCCGEHRQVEIDCPADCVHLGNESYQQRRLLDRAPGEWIRQVMRYDRRDPASRAIFHELNLALCRHAAENRRLDRRSAQESLEFARRRMSLIETPEPYVPLFGGHLLEILDGLIREEALVEREGIREILDEAIRHLERCVRDEQFEEYLKFLRAIYGGQLEKERTTAGPSLIVP